MTTTDSFPRTAGEFEHSLFSTLDEVSLDDDLDFEGAEVRTFEDAGLLTNNAGLVVRLANGAEFQVTIVQSKGADR